MQPDRKQLYRFPWSKTDNPGGWIEVTDSCNIVCRGCYRHQLEGHRSLTILRNEIDDTIRLTNCDCITIAGGEPLIYPELSEVIAYIASKKVKPIVFSNGVNLNPEMLARLKSAGLAKIHLHIDSLQEREGWTGKNEAQLNALRQQYADMIWKTGKIQCGFHVTVYRSNLDEIPDILAWGLKNLQKVQHLSFIAFRSLPVQANLSFFAGGVEISPDLILQKESFDEAINITSGEMFDKLKARFPFLHPCGYLNGTALYETNKFLVMVNVGTKKYFYGNLGKKSLELAQMFYHFFYGRYFAFLNNPKIGHKVFLLSIIDKEVRKAFRQFLRIFISHPWGILNTVFTQSIHLQQPNEIVNGQINLCDDCVNMMVYQGKLINSCRLDEYRRFGEPLTVIKLNT